MRVSAYFAYVCRTARGCCSTLGTTRRRSTWAYTTSVSVFLSLRAAECPELGLRNIPAMRARFQLRTLQVETLCLRLSRSRDRTGLRRCFFGMLAHRTYFSIYADVRSISRFFCFSRFVSHVAEVPCTAVLSSDTSSSTYLSSSSETKTT